MIREEIKARFLAESVEHGKSYLTGDHKSANRLHKKLHALCNRAKEQHQEDVFSEVLNHQDENVRIWAAIFTLNFSPDIAEKVLLDLSKNSGIKITAETILHLWKEGKLDLL